MAKVDPNSLTWKAVQQFVEDKRKEAIEFLISDSSSEQQRGKIALLDELSSLPEQSTTPVVATDTYD